jgi:hypothetical protein
MEREARKYAEQQAEIFREKATDLDQRLHKQMAKVRRCHSSSSRCSACCRANAGCADTLLSPLPAGQQCKL